MILVFDFGASRIKSAIADQDSRKLTNVLESDGGSRAFGSLVPASYFTDVFGEHLNAHVSAAGRVPSSIWVTSEMHGFLLVDRSGQALTPYVSWRSDMAREAGRPELSRKLIASWGDDFIAVTGMRPRIGLPAVNLMAMQRLGSVPQGGHLVGIPEWIVASAGRWSGVTNLTLAAGFGLVQLESFDWSQNLVAAIRDSVLFPEIIRDVSRPLGWITVDHQDVAVHGGVGDLQAALAGLDLTSDVLNLNLGTGSQVSRKIDAADRAGAELRPFFANSFLRTQTHIAAGRSLAAFSDLFDEIANLSGGSTGVFWRLAAGLSVRDLARASIVVDPAIFDSAWNFKTGGSLSRLMEGNMSAREIVAAICNGWLQQYEAATDLVDAKRETKRLLVSGGLPRRLPFVTPSLAERLGRKAHLAPFGNDETLHGLLALATGSHGG